MKILVFCQHENGAPVKASLCALAAAIEIATPAQAAAEISVLVCGTGSDAAAREIANLGYQVLVCADAALDFDRPVLIAQAIEAARNACSATFVVLASTSVGKDTGPRVAAMCDGAQASDIIGVNTDGTFQRPMFAGNVFATVELNSAIKIITVRPTAFQPVKEKAAQPGSISALTVTLDSALAGEIISFDTAKSERPTLADAEVIVSGGRALASNENFQKIVFPLADAFGAAIGASRAAVDSGYAPNDWQVGQTGKVVAPALYVAVGISGAIQHLAGMKDSKFIVAINKDGDAPIYEVADFGLVADLFVAAPELAQAVAKARGK